MQKGRIVLCGSNAYNKKYYFNPLFNKIPDSVKDELQIMCVLFTEEVGGIFTIIFEENGELSLETDADADDVCYDDVSSGLLVEKIRDERQELLESLCIYYRVFVLKEDVSKILEEDDES